MPERDRHAKTGLGYVHGHQPQRVIDEVRRNISEENEAGGHPQHVLVVPVEHTPDLAALKAEEVGPLFSLARRVAIAVEKGLGAGGAFLCVNNKVSQSVAHLHVHVVPRTKGDGLRGFLWPRTKYGSDAEREEYARRIAAALE